MQNAPLEIKNLKKSYEKKLVLKGVSLSVPQSTIFALLGPNGAGKTTLIRSVLNLLKIDSGDILLSGVPHTKHSSRASLSYLPEKFFFYPYYTVEGALDFYGHLYELPKPLREEKKEKISKLLGIESLLKDKISKISKGQLQRVGIACVLMSNSNFILLDEPFSGLDPIGIKEMKDIFLKLKEEGKTVFINSHLLTEVERIVDYVAILNEGVILASGQIVEVKKDHSTLEEAFYSLVKGGV